MKGERSKESRGTGKKGRNQANSSVKRKPKGQKTRDWANQFPKNLRGAKGERGEGQLEGGMSKGLKEPDYVQFPSMPGDQNQIEKFEDIPKNRRVRKFQRSAVVGNNVYWMGGGIRRKRSICFENDPQGREGEAKMRQQKKYVTE